MMAQTMRYRGFTLVELLVVVAIIATLLALLLPAMNKAKEAAVQAKCLAHHRQLGTALQSYASGSGGWLPGPWSQEILPEGGKESWFWHEFIYKAGGPLVDSSDVVRCPKNDGGQYGLYGNKGEPFIKRRVNWTAPNGSMWGVFVAIKMNLAPDPADLLIMADTAFYWHKKDKFDPKGFHTLYRKPTMYQSRHLSAPWSAHGNGINGLFVDGHAEIADDERMVTVGNGNNPNGIIGYYNQEGQEVYLQ